MEKYCFEVEAAFMMLRCATSVIGCVQNRWTLVTVLKTLQEGCTCG